MEVEFVKGLHIRIDDVDVILPYQPDDHVVVNDLCIILMTGWIDPADTENGFRNIGRDVPQEYDHEARDFDIPTEFRNVVAIDNTGNRQWVIEQTDESQADEKYYRELFLVQDRLLSRHSDGQFYQINTDSGEIIDSFSRNRLPIGNTVVTVEGEISSIAELNGKIFVNCSNGEHDIFAFDSKGTEIWRSKLGQRRGRVYIEGGELWERVDVSRNKCDHYRIDPESGERVEKCSNYEE